MAKQTFTTGQVLTAAQMTSLQATALGGGATTAKTVSYTLVAADAGTVVQMNSASATTITVNTALFAQGDTVQIQNVGSGVCTVTAGTATVSTAGSLALSQYEGGQLYFNTTSAALFFDIVQSSGMTNPLTTTGDTIYSSSGTTPARLGIGSTGNVLTVAGGIPSWAAPASGGGMTLLETLTLSGASVVSSAISQSYINLQIIVKGYRPATDGASLSTRINGISSASYSNTSVGAQIYNGTFTETEWVSFLQQDNGTSNSLSNYTIPDYTNSTTWKWTLMNSISNFETTPANVSFQTYRCISNITAAVSTLTFLASTGNMTSGTVYIYGVK